MFWSYSHLFSILFHQLYACCKQWHLQPPSLNSTNTSSKEIGFLTEKGHSWEFFCFCRQELFLLQQQRSHFILKDTNTLINKHLNYLINAGILLGFICISKHIFGISQGYTTFLFLEKHLVLLRSYSWIVVRDHFWQGLGDHVAIKAEHNPLHCI